MNNCKAQCSAVRALALAAGFAVAAASVSAGLTSPKSQRELGGRQFANASQDNAVSLQKAAPAVQVADSAQALVVDADIRNELTAKGFNAEDAEAAARFSVRAECDFGTGDPLTDFCQASSTTSIPIAASDFFAGGFFYQAGADQFIPGLSDVVGQTVQISQGCSEWYTRDFAQGGGPNAWDPVNGTFVTTLSGGPVNWEVLVRYYRDADFSGNPTDDPMNLDAELVASFSDMTADRDGNAQTNWDIVSRGPAIGADGTPGTGDEGLIRSEWFDTGNLFNAFNVLRYEYEHAPLDVTAGDCYWVEIVPWFRNEAFFCWWLSGTGGDGTSYWDLAENGYTAADVQDLDFSLCIDSKIDLSNNILFCSNNPCAFGVENDTCIDSVDAILTPVDNGMGSIEVVEFVDLACATAEFYAPTSPDFEGYFDEFPIGGGGTLSDPGFTNYQGRWYQFVGTGNDMTASVCSALTEDTGANYYIQVYCGSCDSLYPVTGGAEDECPLFPDSTTSFAEVTVPTTNGTTYFLLVGTAGGVAGNVELVVTDTQIPSTMVDPDQCGTCTIDTSGLTIDVTETETCDDADLGTIDPLGTIPDSRSNDGCALADGTDQAQLDAYDTAHQKITLNPSGTTVLTGNTWATEDRTNTDNFQFSVASQVYVEFTYFSNFQGQGGIRSYEVHPNFPSGDVAYCGTGNFVSAFVNNGDGGSTIFSDRCEVDDDGDAVGVTYGAVLDPSFLYVARTFQLNSWGADCASGDTQYVGFIDIFDCPKDLTGLALEPDLCGETAGNFGCNVADGGTPTYTDISVGSTFGGTTFTDYDATEVFGGDKDLDWYNFTMPASGQISFNFSGEVPLFVLLVSNPLDCDNAVTEAAVYFPACFEGDAFEVTEDVNGDPLVPGATYSFQVRPATEGFEFAGTFEGSGVPVGLGCSAYTGIVEDLAGPSCVPDITTDGANPGDPDFLVPDGSVTVSDLTTFVEQWVALDASVADITTDGANPGDPDFLVPDGSVTVSDLTTFVELWVAGCP
ncbi:MAG: GC-type dockerin domain-anchored protein [Planctomycetota bacterium]